MIRTMFLVPVRDNDGRRMPRPIWQQIDRWLLAAFGGYTIVHGVTGAWQADDRVCRDRNRMYLVSLTSWRQLPAWLDLVERIRVLTRQEALFIEVAGESEIIGPVDGA